MAVTLCRTCRCKCHLISLQCLLESDTVLSQELDNDKILGALDTVQRLYILPLLGDCYDLICTALQENFDNGTAIPDEYSNLIEALTPYLISATEYQYAKKNSFGKLTQAGVIMDENLKVSLVKEWLAGLKEDRDLHYIFVETYLETNADGLTCLPVKEDLGDCYQELDVDLPFETTSPTNQLDYHVHPDEDKYYDYPMKRYDQHDRLSGDGTYDSNNR